MPDLPSLPTWPQRPPAFHGMVKPRGSICNLDCHYCFYLKKEKLYPDGRFRMSNELLENYTRQYIEAQSTSEVTFAWQGGEPVIFHQCPDIVPKQLQLRHPDSLPQQERTPD